MAKNNNTIIWIIGGILAFKFKDVIFSVFRFIGLMPKTDEEKAEEEQQKAENKTSQLISKYPNITHTPEQFARWADDIKSALDGVNSSVVHDDIVFDIFEKLTTADDVRALNWVWGVRRLSFMGYSADYTLKSACKDELTDSWFVSRTYTNTVLPKFSMAGI